MSNNASNHFSRRNFMTLCLAVMGINAFSPISLIHAADAPEQKTQNPGKPLIAYFSHSGHTKALANAIHKKIGGDIIEIETVEAYPQNYQQVVDLAKEEQKNNARPAIKTKINDLSQYDVVFLGYPNWWSSMPMPVYTFIEENKLDGKTIAPFTTHGGGGLGHSIEDLKKLMPHSKILKPLAVNGNHVSSAEKDIEKWLEGLGTALIQTTTGNTAIYPDGGY